MTHGHEPKGGGCRAEWNKGEKKWDNCNSIINKIYFSKKDSLISMCVTIEHQNTGGKNPMQLQREKDEFTFMKLCYCCSITIVCIFSPPLYPTPANPTSLPCCHPPPWFCPSVLDSGSWKPFSPLSPPPSSLAVARWIRFYNWRLQYPYIDRSGRQKFRKNIVELSNPINQLDLTDIYRVLHQTTEEYTLFSNSCGTFPNIYHI